MSPSSSPAWLTGATRSCSFSRPSSRAGSQTDAHAVPDTPARVDDGTLPRRHDDRARPEVGNRRRALEHLARAGVDLGAGQAHGLAQRLGQLQQQLVHRDGPGQPAAEGPQHLVGRLTRAVDEAGGRLAGTAHGPGRRSARRRRRPPWRAPATSLSPVVFGAWPEPEHDDQVDGRHHDDEPEDRQDLHQPPAPVWRKAPALAGQETRAGPGPSPAAATAPSGPGQPTSRWSTVGDQRDRGGQRHADAEPLQPLPVGSPMDVT